MDTKKKPHGYWSKGPGRETMRAVHQGELTQKEAAEMEGVSIGTLQGQLHYWRKHEQLLPSAAGRPSIRPSEEALKKSYQAIEKTIDDFVVLAIRDKMAAVVADRDRLFRLKTTLEQQVLQLQKDLAQLRAVAKSVEASKVKEIIKRAGAVGAD